ncbi:MAG: rhodanese-like domain-containing protein [Candidatus Eisenbacteria bacterium]|uniref:Rhodanese-like domain-containing protein n=1 Tax=Eiseniibacteriota bacterium TaxID=2212470 RepID=A0A937XCA7_UNCEI|nr:rhodanese-like domain-containing protein [Candidatus Eisenbacteria bacterium]
MRWLGHRLVEASALVLLALVLGLTLNAVRREPLPYDLPASLLLTQSGARVVFTGEARRLFDDAHFVFVDAREEHEFLEAHIEGSLSLPPARFDELYPELRLWTAGQPLLVYGESGNILAADDLARQLLAAGEELVVILAGGLDAWRSHGHPVDGGPEGLLGAEGSAAPAPRSAEPADRAGGEEEEQ